MTEEWNKKRIQEMRDESKRIVARSQKRNNRDAKSLTEIFADIGKEQAIRAAKLHKKSGKRRKKS